MLLDKEILHLDSHYPVAVASAQEGIERFPTATDQEKQAITALLISIHTSQPDALLLIYTAVEKALTAHQGQNRLSGEPYSMHLFSSAILAAQMGISPEITVATLLHDTVEDTDYTLEQIRKDFGPKVTRIVDAATKVRGRHTVEDTAYKFLNALVRDPEAVIPRAVEQLHNAATLYAQDEEAIDRMWRRTIEFTAPLVKAFGLPDIARQLINLTTYYRFLEQAQKIMSFIEETGCYTNQQIEIIATEIRKILKLKPEEGELIYEAPTLNDLINSTHGDRAPVAENMITNFYLVYDGDGSDAYVLFSKLEYAFGLAHQNINDGKQLPHDKPIQQLKEEKRLEFFHIINGRIVKFRLLPRTDFNFEQTSLIPLFQVNPQADEDQLIAARRKLERWQTTWQRFQRKQAKGLTVQEFIKFLEGKGSIIVLTPPTSQSSEGHTYELPLGATVYDLIAGLPLPKKKAQELLLYVNRVTSQRSNEPEKELVPHNAPLPNDVTVRIYTGNEITLTADQIDHVITADGLKDMRREIEQLMKTDPVMKKAVRKRGLARITTYYCNTTGATSLDVPPEKLAGAFASHFKIDLRPSASLTKPRRIRRKRGLLKKFRQALEEEFGLYQTSEYQKAFLVALVKYRASLIPIPITANNREGLDRAVADVFASNDIDVVRKEVAYPEADQATITTFIDPNDKDKMHLINDALTKLKEAWET